MDTTNNNRWQRVLIGFP